MQQMCLEGCEMKWFLYSLEGWFPFDRLEFCPNPLVVNSNFDHMIRRNTCKLYGDDHKRSEGLGQPCSLGMLPTCEPASQPCKPCITCESSILLMRIKNLKKKVEGNRNKVFPVCNAEEKTVSKSTVVKRWEAIANFVHKQNWTRC